MSKKQWHEVRVREKIAPGKWVKKSKFYLVDSPSDAAAKYKGTGSIMWVEKAPKEKLFGIGDFFKLGDQFLKELKGEGTLLNSIGGNNKEKRRQRRFNKTRFQGSD